MRCLAILALLAGCAVARESEETHAEQWKEEFKDIPVAYNRDVDLLFVIDDSSSMADEQDRLAANFPVFVQVLETLEGGLPNLHIGVVSSDLADSGSLLVGHPACQPRGAPYIVDVADGLGGRIGNYPGTLAEALACNATLGADGDDHAQHLESARLALEDSTPQNAGFLRDDAYLMVVIIADEDDGSPAAPSDYASVLRSVKDDASLVVVSLIVASESCPGASPAPRLIEFAQLFPNRNALTTICNDDLSDGFAVFSCDWCDHVGNPCIESDLVDVDPATDMLDYECVVSEVRDPGTSDQEETVLPHCDSPITQAPCWHLVEDRLSCPETPTGMTLVVERGGLSVPNGTHVMARCRTE